MNLRVSFLETLSDTCELMSVPYSDRDFLFRVVSKLEDHELQFWIESVDRSPFPLSEWITSLLVFRNWLSTTSQERSFTGQIEYLNCCIQGYPNSGNLLTLKDLLENYLNHYGIE